MHRADRSPLPEPQGKNDGASHCWKATVATTAQSWADGCDYGHNPNLGVLGLGENIFACSGTGGVCASDPITFSSTRWGNEADSYDYGSNTCSQRCQGGTNAGTACSNQSECPGGGLCANACGHYTQIVWRSTTHVGCGIQTCSTNSPFGPMFPDWTFVVCNYEPPGNLIGQSPY